MKILEILLVLLIGFQSFANATSISSKFVKPLTIRIMSDDNGLIKEEKLCCTRETCCFKENYYCDMEDGKCICDLYMPKEGPNQKEYWMEITGILSGAYCEKPQLLHKLTSLCLCDQLQPPPSGVKFGSCRIYLPPR